MSETLIKNIEKSEVLTLTELVQHQPGQVVSRTLAQRPSFNLTLFAFDQGEGISTHSSPGDAMVQILEGEAEVTIGGQVFTVGVGQTIVMPANVPHGLEAKQPFKMLLTVCKP